MCLKITVVTEKKKTVDSGRNIDVVRVILIYFVRIC